MPRQALPAPRPVAEAEPPHCHLGRRRSSSPSQPRRLPQRRASPARLPRISSSPTTPTDACRRSLRRVFACRATNDDGPDAVNAGTARLWSSGTATLLRALKRGPIAECSSTQTATISRRLQGQRARTSPWATLVARKRQMDGTARLRTGPSPQGTEQETQAPLATSPP